MANEGAAHRALPARILDAVDQAVAATDPDGRITAWNRAAEALYGWSADEALGRPLGEIVPVHELVADGGAGEGDLDVPRRDGSLVSARIAVTPLGADGGAVVVSTDRTPWLDLERAVGESEARLRVVFSSIDEGFCLAEIITDAAGRPVDYRFLEVNPQFEAMTGLADPVGRTAFELVPDLEQHWVEAYATVAFGDAPRRFESRSAAMGRWFDVFAVAVPPRGRFALVFSDVTERRRVEAERRDRQADERRARRRAELLAEVVGALGAADGVRPRAQRLVDVLVPRIASVAEVRLPDGSAPVVARTTSAGSEPDLTVPVPIGAGSAARLSLTLRAPWSADADDDLRLVHEIAQRCGLALGDARLREEEREIAHRLQRALLPESVAVAPGIAIAARYEAGSDSLEVGGDWYDSFILPDGRVGVSVGDVVGHGLDAAATMGRLRNALAALAPRHDGAGAVLGALDEFARGPNGSEFVTACYVVIDPVTGAVQHSSAGHPPALVVAPSGDARWLDDGRSPPLATIPVDARPEGVTRLEPGATLVLFSDGLIERRHRPLDAGMALIERSARLHRADPPDELCDRLVEAAFAGAPPDDDAVVVCVRVERRGAISPG